MKKSITVLFIIIALLGVGLSIYALQLHFSEDVDTFCNINQRFNCDIVNKGKYSEVAGIPVALLGIIGYASLALGAFVAQKRKELWEYLMMAAGLGLAFALYLTYLEAFVIHAYCLVCLGSQLLILLAFILSVIQLRHVRHSIS